MQPDQDPQNTEQDIENEEVVNSSDGLNDEQSVSEDPQPEGEELSPEAALQAKVETLEAQVTENWDKFLRANAELENVRKRARKDVESAHKYGIEKFAASVLDVSDSLDQGLERARTAAEARKDDSEVTALLEGMELTAKQLNETLAKHGIEKISAEGVTFDPELHEAMSAIESEDAPPNTVIAVMRQGYTLSGRLLRPAMVMVSKAPANAE